MGINRRDFLKIAGLSTLLGVGGKAAFELLVPGSLEARIDPIPLTKGKRWAVVIDMAKMNEEIMDKCIEACHNYHNVPNVGNSKDAVFWIWKEKYKHAFPEQGYPYVPETFKERNFLLLCNHCTNPPCVRVCPTKATWKREDGVVMMDQHRCIGCRFCMAGCPYGVRSFNWGDPRKAPKELNPNFPTNPNFPSRMKGVVEKCTLCNLHLDKGKLPECVKAANEMEKDSIIFGDLANPKSQVREILRTRYSIRRKPELGTEPNLFFIV
jgi:Fe-S-cluster-containing dehydrogenase component